MDGLGKVRAQVSAINAFLFKEWRSVETSVGLNLNAWRREKGGGENLRPEGKRVNMRDRTMREHGVDKNFPPLIEDARVTLHPLQLLLDKCDDEEVSHSWPRGIKFRPNFSINGVLSSINNRANPI